MSRPLSLCVFPQLRTWPLITFFTGDDKPVSTDLQPGFYNFECDCLDAPIFVASGSIRSSRFGLNVSLDQQAYRYRAGYEFRG